MNVTPLQVFHSLAGNFAKEAFVIAVSSRGALLDTQIHLANVWWKLLNLWKRSKEEPHWEKKMTGNIKHYHALKGFIFVIYTNKLRISSSVGTAPFLVKTKSSSTSWGVAPWRSQGVFAHPLSFGLLHAPHSVSSPETEPVMWLYEGFMQFSLSSTLLSVPVTGELHEKHAHVS